MILCDWAHLEENQHLNTSFDVSSTINVLFIHSDALCGYLDKARGSDM